METTSPLRTFRTPAAFIPLLMSLAALTVVVVQVLFFGTAREADEGTSAHLFQLLMGGQVPVIAYFVVKSRRRGPDGVFLVIGAQLLAAAAALGPVAMLGL